MKCDNGAGIDFALALWGARVNEIIDHAKYILKALVKLWILLPSVKADSDNGKLRP